MVYTYNNISPSSDGLVLGIPENRVFEYPNQEMG